MSKFTYGDTVKVNESADVKLRPGQTGSIVGIQPSQGQTTYTVEFGDGADCEIDESLLEGGDDATRTSAPKAIK